ncbi:MAG TPA: PHP domain-containing protein, partial [Thiobacillaceae bacterium]|nr:PHP domain-containing protein [Thiobacillaceae bacterium]
MTVYDLHCHSTASDGMLSPRELVERAAGLGVDFLALTDHDELSGLDEAREVAKGAGLTLVPGVEISVTWHGRTLHVVGLGVDPADPVLCEGLAHNRNGRAARAERIAEELDRLGISGA